ncbi:uncharacterized protein [Coffea arabica]|uniref:Uncharacterized protein isoform X2 n=1 Tax=Coffea arabica TaxID=13443 RepID=A0A6P6V6F2_COFAR|nr:uncharacterized protein LOC113717035 isoform X2 [Coffea arabica]
MSSTSSLFVLSLPLKLCNGSSNHDSSKHPPLPFSGDHVRSLAGSYTLRQLNQLPSSLSFRAPSTSSPVHRSRRRCICFYSGSFVLTGLIETAAIPYLGVQIRELSLDEKAEILFLDQAITTAAVLAVLYGITSSFGPLPEDVFRYDIREPFNLQKGWIVWAGIGLAGALVAIALTGVAVSFFSGETPQRETDALVRLLPLIGSSSISTACLVGITGILAPLLEETVFRGFFMVALTKWLPTPLSIVVSAAVFAIAHLTPGEFPQLFVLGIALGLSYAQTRNLLTPITIHALWNSGVILLLTFLELQGYDIREMIQAS